MPPSESATTRRVALVQRADFYVAPALALRLAAAGHDLVLHLPREGLAEEAAALGAAVEVITEADTPRTGPGSDATAEGMQLIAQRALERFGRLDAAALRPPSGSGRQHVQGDMLGCTPEDVHSMIGYLEATMHALQAVIPAMRGDGGQILVFTSDAGSRPEAGWSIYGGVRAGQNVFIQSVALEHARKGLCLNVLASKNTVFPGFLDSPPGVITDSSVTLGPWAKPYLDETPLDRLGTMEELAAFCTVLLDGTNRFQTGQVFHYSGGWNIA